MDTQHGLKYFVLVASLLVVFQVLSVNADWDYDRPSNWKGIKEKWEGCPRQFRMLQAPYCYRYWRYFENLDPWFGRSIADNSRYDWYAGGWGYAPIRKMNHRRNRKHSD